MFANILISNTGSKMRNLSNLSCFQSLLFALLLFSAASNRNIASMASQIRTIYSLCNSTDVSERMPRKNFEEQELEGSLA